MHEIMNGLNPRGDARLLEALGLTRKEARNAESEREPSRQSEIVIRRCARLVARRVHTHTASDDPGANSHRDRTTTRRE